MGGKLSDLLGEDALGRLVENSVSEGDVYRMHLGDEENVRAKHEGDDGRNKYFVVLGHDNEGNAIGLVLINTKINTSLPQKRKDMHYELRAEKYDFLNGRKRYVDCSDFKIIAKSKFTGLFGGSAKGKIEDDDLRLIREAVATYEDTPKVMIHRFGLDRND